MEVLPIINKYYADNFKLRHILIEHSNAVAEMALEVAHLHPELNADRTFLYEAAMLHDIGIFLTNAPGIECYGTQPYICHGILGAKLLVNEGLIRHARVAERHTGTGITTDAIQQQNLPLPMRDYSPETIEEQIICYADKFFSKTHLERRRTPEQVLRSLEKFGDGSIARMKQWLNTFG
ncbi:MAG: HDIG domain-containing protein [Bacteroidaceae bacterium]|nr:HDIG domain-containing protein [Bacteroidaceae bacterium]